MKVTCTLPIIATAALLAATTVSAEGFSLSGARSAMQSDISFNDMQSAGQGQIKLRHKIQPKAQVRLVRTVPLHHIVMAQAGEWHDRLPVRH